jgi:hypothetical protein
MCILAKDFMRAKKYYDVLSSADPSYFDTKRTWQQFMQLALMFEGLAKKALQEQPTGAQGRDRLKTALEYFRTGCNLAEAHRTEIEDPALGMNKFGFVDVSVCFSTAAWVCMRLSALSAPTDDGSWAAQTLSFIERRKAMNLLNASLSTWDDTVMCAPKLRFQLRFHLEIDSTIAILGDQRILWLLFEEYIDNLIWYMFPFIALSVSLFLAILCHQRALEAQI